MSRWTLCNRRTPDSERQVIVVCPDAHDTEAAHWLASESAWVRAGTNEQIWPTFWREMPENPMQTE